MLVRDKYIKAHEALVALLAEKSNDTWAEEKRFTKNITRLCEQVQEQLEMHLERQNLEELKESLKK